MTVRRAAVILIGVLIITASVVALLISVFERQQEARLTYFKVIDLADDEPDPALWGKNFPRQYEAYMQTMRTSELVKYSAFGRYGGSESFSRLDKYPNLTRLFAGYPFSVDYREDQGHLRAMEDLLDTKRLGNNKPGACISCKTSNFKRMDDKLGAAKLYATPLTQLIAENGPMHSISCADCHEPQTMQLRLTRPAFIEAMQTRGIDVGKATRQEMRTYVCAQCHVEYYFKGADRYLTFPWQKGLRIDDIAAYYDEILFKDWEHAETKTAMVKIQHPEYELWSTGIHARSGVSCTDCHMPYKREGAIKVTDHWIRTPLVNLTNTCGTCHRYSEAELTGRILGIQDSTYKLMVRAETAIVAAQDAIKTAMALGLADSALQNARDLHRQAAMRWDFVSAENSMGFHSPQEAARILGDAIDYARQAELAAVRAAGSK